MADALKQPYDDLEDLGRADLYLDEILDIVHRIRLFDDLNLDEIRMLCHHMRCYAAPRHYPLLEAGARGDYLLLILTGMAELKRAGAAVESAAEVAAGATVGEVSMLDGQPRCVGCVATVPTDFAVLTRDALNHVLLQAPRLGNKLLLTLLQMMAGQLRAACACAQPSAV